MNFKTPLTALFCLSIGAAGASAADFQTGLKTLSIIDNQSERHLQGYLWYPTTDATATVPAHGNQVWEPISVIPDANPVAGEKPLLVLSHGMFGNARNQAWLAEAMTDRGYLVAAIDHPGTSTFARDPDDRRELWKRPKDISRTIDYLLADPEFGKMIDPERIFMAGHSLGGFTAVALAGGRYDPSKVEADCATDPTDLICEIFTSWEVGKSAEDRVEMAADLSDTRIAGFAVLDLGGTQTFTPESLASINRPMFVIGAPEDISGLDLDRESRALVAALPEGAMRYDEPEGLAHFDFLGVCTEKGLAILKEEEPEDAFVCEKGTDERRAEHARIATDIAGFFSGK